MSGIDRAVGRGVPETVHALSSLPAVDYVDHFGLSTPDAARVTPEQWARAMFGDVPSLGEQLIWRGLLGFRLTRGPSPDTVAGWRITRGDDWVRLETASWFLSGNLVVRVEEDRVRLTTFIHYERLVGRAVWPPLSAVHRALVPGVLRGAAARVRRSVRDQP